MRQSIALVNLKPGTAKTTSAVWLAHAFHAAGHSVLLVDADPAASALEWSDLADGFPFRIVGLATRELHRRVAEFARPDDVVVIDAPQMEDHAGIARSAMEKWFTCSCFFISNFTKSPVIIFIFIMIKNIVCC